MKNMPQMKGQLENNSLLNCHLLRSCVNSPKDSQHSLLSGHVGSEGKPLHLLPTVIIKKCSPKTGA